MLLGAVLAWVNPNETVSWWLLPFVLLAGLLYHSAANVVSDYFDYKRGVDRVGTMGGSGVLVGGLMQPRTLFVGGLAMFAAGTALGLWMVSIRGVPLLYLGLAGLIGGFFYGGWPLQLKYRGLGELVIFLLFGPLMVIGSYFVLTGSLGPLTSLVLVSLPIGLLVAAILNANNFRDIADDSHAGITTVSNAFGVKVAAAQYYILVAGAYLSVIVMVAFSVIPYWTLLVALSIPPALKVIRKIHSTDQTNTSDLALIDQMTAQVHLLFGVLLMLGILLGELF